MGLQWSDSLSVGVGAIDAQHKELVLRVARVLDAVVAEPAEVGKLLDFLGEYAVSHFGTEERLMEQFRYPEPKAVQHREAHSGFVRQFGGMRYDVEAEGLTQAIRDRIEKWMVNWLVEHILGLDRQLGAFIASVSSGTQLKGTWIVPREDSLLVVAVTANGSLDRAGLGPGDEIVEVDGHDVRALGPERAAALLRDAPDGIVKVLVRPRGDPSRCVPHTVIRKRAAVQAT
jgi:hemerythrin